MPEIEPSEQGGRTEQGEDREVRRQRLVATFARLDEIVRRLKRRDRETLDLILRGEMNKQIAASQGITERAVEMRRATLLRKFDVTSTAALIGAAITHSVLREASEVTADLGLDERSPATLSPSPR